MCHDVHIVLSWLILVHLSMFRVCSWVEEVDDTIERPGADDHSLDVEMAGGYLLCVHA